MKDFSHVVKQVHINISSYLETLFNVKFLFSWAWMDIYCFKIGLSILSAFTLRRLLVLPRTLSNRDAILLRTIASNLGRPSSCMYVCMYVAAVELDMQSMFLVQLLHRLHVYK